LQDLNCGLKKIKENYIEIASSLERTACVFQAVNNNCIYKTIRSEVLTAETEKYYLLGFGAV
jgi:hypothetical protein